MCGVFFFILKKNPLQVKVDNFKELQIYPAPRHHDNKPWRRWNLA